MFGDHILGVSSVGLISLEITQAVAVFHVNELLVEIRVLIVTLNATLDERVIDVLTATAGVLWYFRREELTQSGPEYPSRQKHFPSLRQIPWPLQSYGHLWLKK